MKIALIIDSIESEHSHMILVGATSVFDEKEVSVTTYQIGSLIDDQDPFNYQNRSVETLITKENTDGIIFLALPHFHFESNEYLVKYLSQFKDIPVVSIGYINEEIPSVAYSSKECITEIVDHLIQVHGHKRIALFTVDTESKEAQEREDAFREAIKKNGIEYDENLTMIGNYDYDVAMESLMEHKKKFGYDFDAIVSIDDDMAFACVDTLHHEKIKIPEEIAVTGFDNSIRSYSDELGLTTGSQKTKEQGALAVKMIHDILLGKKIEKHACIQAKAIFRESCGCKRNLENDDESKPITTSEWYNQRNQFLSVIKLYTLMQFEMPYSTVRSKLKYELITIGVRDACVCLFENPMNTKKSKQFELPDKAYVSVAYNSDNTVQIGETEATIEFDPREKLVPDGLFNNLDKMIVMALYRFSTLIGYIVFKPGDFDLGVYSLIHKIISNSLVASMKISYVQNENRNLHSAVAEATKDSISDELTELFNRRGLFQFGQAAIDACIAMKGSGTVVFGDLDGLKFINDTYGHDAGDRAIIAEAKILRKIFRESDVIARLGGDEFCIVAPGLVGSAAASLASRIKAECDLFNKNAGESFTLSISIGQILFSSTDETLDLHDILTKADYKLYEEKRRKKNIKNKIDL